MYTSESIINALKKNNNLQFNKEIDVLKCPSPGTHNNNNIECNDNPNNCDLCKNQKCKQPLTVNLRNSKYPLIVLNFRFVIMHKYKSGHIPTGFIRKKDSDLLKIIKKLKLINEEDLESVQL
jgi:hypothetical protein